ncbi:hypothetical protein RJT34_30632 [Clitoria ternatea]|uniref:Uncharacterized protein n=1 Tax=Clitoria ternatea TaxID=43366 RepID=A0AAN9I0K6_CLITE
MEERVPHGHVEDLTYLEPKRLAFNNTSASAKRVVPVVTPDPRDEIIKQLREELAELRREHSTSAESSQPYSSPSCLTSMKAPNHCLCC